jgi:DNA primase
MGFTTGTQVNVQDLKDRVDLLELIERDTELRKEASTRGGEYAGPCPFCGGHDRLRVQPEQGIWWCRSCSDGEQWQDAIAYIQKRDNSTFIEACRALEAGAGRSTSEPSVRPRSPAPPTDSEEPSSTWRTVGLVFLGQCEDALWASGGEAARAYLHGRGLSDDTVRAWRLGFNGRDGWDSPSEWGLTSLDNRKVWRPRGIVLPWFVDGDLWQLKVRRAEGDPRYAAVRGGHPLIFGSHTLEGRQAAVLTEGEFDAMLVHQEAGDLVGTATLGSASKGLGDAALSCLLPVGRLLAAYDMDKEGDSGAQRLAAMSARVRRVRVPVGKDVTELWQRGGRVRDWVEYELECLAANGSPAAVAAAKRTPAQGSAEPEEPRAKYPFEVRWGRELRWLALRDPFDGRWTHEVQMRDCPSHWVDMARDDKARRLWASS